RSGPGAYPGLFVIASVPSFTGSGAAMPVARGRRIAAALTPAALVMVMVSASAPRTAAADLSAPGARVVVPPTVARTVPLAPRGFTPEMRGDVLRTRAATTS